MQNPEIKADVKFGNLEKLIKQMADEYEVRVGILGDKGSQEVSEDLDVAGLGAVHEFGARIPVTDKLRGFFLYHFGIRLKKDTEFINIPARSFLKQPIERSEELRKKIKEKTQIINNNDVELVQYLIEQGDKGLLDLIANAVGLSAWEQVHEAFRTEGFGEWKPNSKLTVNEKGSSKPLIDKGRLENSITFEVKKKD